VVGVDIMFKVNKEFKSANISRTVRFTEPLFEQLNKTAAENNISFNLLVLQCCKYALDNMDDEKN
jgi:predicted HicB family RNase H-like nuclease